ncbi:unnamed protein product [Amoebophrya sp. A120]|nr:unnamed protein product [Amoebophrya sp. A120]|eukprot:GSA120T00021754001.1
MSRFQRARSSANRAPPAVEPYQQRQQDGQQRGHQERKTSGNNIQNIVPPPTAPHIMPSAFASGQQHVDNQQRGPVARSSRGGGAREFAETKGHQLQKSQQLNKRKNKSAISSPRVQQHPDGVVVHNGSYQNYPPINDDLSNVKLSDGSFVCGKLMGKGGSAEVYEVKRDNKQYALKVVSAKTPMHMAIFQEEVNLLKKFRDTPQGRKHVIRCHDSHAIADKGQLFILLEYAECDFLAYQSSFLRPVIVENEKGLLDTKMYGGGMPLEEVIRCWAQMVDSVALIHEYGIVHFDLKPQNYLMVANDRYEKYVMYGGGRDRDRDGKIIGNTNTGAAPASPQPHRLSPSGEGEAAMDHINLQEPMSAQSTGRSSGASSSSARSRPEGSTTAPIGGANHTYQPDTPPAASSPSPSKHERELMRRQTSNLSAISELDSEHDFDEYVPPGYRAIETGGGRGTRTATTSNLQRHTHDQSQQEQVLDHTRTQTNQTTTSSRDESNHELQIKLSDFGLARSLDGDKSHITMDAQIGTVRYMSPENFFQPEEMENNAAGTVKLRPEADIWSLGIILYAMIHNKTPHEDIKSHRVAFSIVDPRMEIQYPFVERFHGNFKGEIRPGRLVCDAKSGRPMFFDDKGNVVHTGLTGLDNEQLYRDATNNSSEVERGAGHHLLNPPTTPATNTTGTSSSNKTPKQQHDPLDQLFKNSDLPERMEEQMKLQSSESSSSMNSDHANKNKLGGNINEQQSSLFHTDAQFIQYEHLNFLLQKCLQRDPNQRWSAKRLKESLRFMRFSSHFSEDTAQIGALRPIVGSRQAVMFKPTPSRLQTTTTAAAEVSTGPPALNGAGAAGAAGAAEQASSSAAAPVGLGGVFVTQQNAAVGAAVSSPAGTAGASAIAAENSTSRVVLPAAATTAATSSSSASSFIPVPGKRPTPKIANIDTVELNTMRNQQFKHNPSELRRNMNRYFVKNMSQRDKQSLNLYEDFDNMTDAQKMHMFNDGTMKRATLRSGNRVALRQQQQQGQGGGGGGAAGADANQAFVGGLTMSQIAAQQASYSSSADFFARTNTHNTFAQDKDSSLNSDNSNSMRVPRPVSTRSAGDRNFNAFGGGVLIRSNTDSLQQSSTSQDQDEGFPLLAGSRTGGSARTTKDYGDNRPVAHPDLHDETVYNYTSCDGAAGDGRDAEAAAADLQAQQGGRPLATFEEEKSSPWCQWSWWIVIVVFALSCVSIFFPIYLMQSSSPRAAPQGKKQVSQGRAAFIQKKQAVVGEPVSPVVPGLAQQEDAREARDEGAARVLPFLNDGAKEVIVEEDGTELQLAETSDSEK